MKVLVLGGTGAMGVHLVQLLSDSGIQTIVTSRQSKKAEKNISYLQGNAHEIEFLQTILNTHWDVIVDFMVYTTAEFQERVNLLLGATSQYIFISSSRVYAGSENLITESSPRLLDISKDEDFLSTDEYSLTKARQEDILINSGMKNWTIIRPYITYSEDRLQLGVLEKEEWLFRALHGRTIVFSNDICSKLTTMTYGYDVAKGIASVIGKKETSGEIFHITSPKSCLWEDVLATYLNVLEEYLGQKPKVLLIDIDRFLKNRNGKYQVFYDRLYNRKFDNSKIAKFVNIDTFIKEDSGLASCLNVFLEKQNFRFISGRAEALKDRITGERASLGEIPHIRQKLAYLFYRYFTN